MKNKVLGSRAYPIKCLLGGSMALVILGYRKQARLSLNKQYDTLSSAGLASSSYPWALLFVSSNVCIQLFL